MIGANRGAKQGANCTLGGANCGANLVQIAPRFASHMCNSWCKQGAICTIICTMICANCGANEVQFAPSFAPIMLPFCGGGVFWVGWLWRQFLARIPFSEHLSQILWERSFHMIMTNIVFIAGRGCVLHQRKHLFFLQDGLYHARPRHVRC